jgi:hypothetical protein
LRKENKKQAGELVLLSEEKTALRKDISEKEHLLESL